MNISKSISLFQEAQTLLPGGVDLPVRAFRAVGGQPLFIERGEDLISSTWMVTVTLITSSPGDL